MRRAATLFTMLLAALLPYSSSPVAAQEQPVVHFLGFTPGEERRYVLGPPDALNENEWANWSIRLEAVAGDPPLGKFSLTHERNDPALKSDLPHVPPVLYWPLPFPIPRGAGPAFNDPVHVELSGQLQVNHKGFPLALVFSGMQRFSGRINRMHVTYTLDDDGYIKDVAANGREWSVEIPLGTDVRLATDPLAGLHVYYPTSMPCLGRGSTAHYLVDHTGLLPHCDTPVLLFANPGLLSLALEGPWQPDGEPRHLWFLTPTGPLLHGPGASPYSSATALARDESQYFRRESFESIGQSTINVGPRRVTAWALDVAGPLDKVYLDDEGRVLRVDLGPHPITSRPRWIRLQWPSEY